jgi:aldose 1-epimerase
MAFSVSSAPRTAGDKSGDVYELLAADGSARAEVWPQCGFNCLKWQVRDGGNWADILFHMPDWDTNPVPTRSGNPILFPFPGRLRDGRITHEGKTYQLPLTDNTKLHSIHGFTPRNKWRVVGHAAAPECASVTGEFALSADLPEALAYWPADFRFQVTYRLFAHKLQLVARVENPTTGRLPFGLGYHGYFCLPGVTDADVSNYVLKANVAQLWAAENNLPTGVRVPVPAELDFQTPRAVGATALDNVFSGVNGPTDAGLVEQAVLSHPQAKGKLRVLADPAFRELVLFTPAHRKAVAIEPYSCSADASNLAARGADTGWRVLEAGAHWEAVVEYRYEAN